MDTEEKDIIRKLLHEPGHAETIQKIINNMPSLHEYLDGWKEIVTDVCGVKDDSLIVYIYPSSRGPARELKISITEWIEKAKIPFTLMLLKTDEAVFSIRLLLWHQYVESGNSFFDEYNDSLKTLEKNSNGIVKYTKLAGWGVWYSVLSSEFGEFQETQFNPYNKDWKIEAKNILQKQLLVANTEGKTLLQLIQDNLG